MYALVEIKGKQYKAEAGAILRVDRFDSQQGDTLTFDSVLMVSDEKQTRLGQPYLKGAAVKAVVQEHGKGRKIRVFKYKKRKNYRRTLGHRQQYTLLKIEEITGA